MPKLWSLAACCSLLALRLPAQTCDAARGAPDSLPAKLVARFAVDGDRDSVSPVDADSLGSELRSALRLSDPAPIAEWTPSIGETVPTLHGDYTLLVDRNGTIRDVRIVRPSLVRSIDSALVAALRAATLPPRDERARWIMHVSLNTPQQIPTFVSKPVPAQGVDVSRHTASSESVTLVEFGQRVPVWRTPTKLPKLVRMGSPPMAAASVTGTVAVSAVVDEKGRVIRGSVYPAFPVEESRFDVARMVAEDYEFTPFTVNGCAVKLYMILPITFAGRP